MDDSPKFEIHHPQSKTVNHNFNHQWGIWWGVVILLLAGLLRLPALHNLPPGLSQDEVLNGDIVRSIRDGEHAFFFPQGFGHEPLYHYWSVPFQRLLGDNILSVRLPSAMLGILAVALLIRLGRDWFGQGVGLLAGAGMAISWWGIVFSRVGIRPMLEVVTLTLFGIYFPRKPVIAGIFLSASIYSYTAARYNYLLPLLFLIGILIISRLPKQKRAYLRPALLCCAIAFALSAPMFMTLQAHPEWQERVIQLSGPLDSLRDGDIRPLTETTLATLGVLSFTGDPRWTYGLPNRPLFDPITALFFTIGLAWVVWHCRQPRSWLLLVWLGFTLLPSAVTPQAPSTVRLVGAMPVVYLLLGIGVWQVAEWVKRRNFRNKNTAEEARKNGERGANSNLFSGRWLIAGILSLLFLLNIFRTWYNGFQQWGNHPETRLRYQSVWLDVARYWQNEPNYTPVFTDGFFALIDAQTVERNVGRKMPARWVQVGDGVAGALILPATAPARLYVPEYAPPSPLLLTGIGVDNQPIFRSPLAPSFAVYDLPQSLAIETIVSPVTLDGKLTLLGVTASASSTDWLSFWQVDAPLPDDLSLFFHVLSADGQIITQHDGFDAAASTLRAGDLVVQLHPLPLPSDASPVTAWQIGAYTRHDGMRLTHMGEPADHIFFDGTLPKR